MKTRRAFSNAFCDLFHKRRHEETPLTAKAAGCATISHMNTEGPHEHPGRTRTPRTGMNGKSDGTPPDRYVREAQLRREKVISFEAYPFNLPAVRHLEALDLHPAVTFLVGENGSGKSTLREALAVAWGFNPEGGTKNFRFGTRASHSVLHEYLRLVHRRRNGGQ